MLAKKVWMTAPVMAVMLCGTAHAALSVDSVWADLQGAAATNGLRITVATEVEGDGELTLNGVSVAMEGGPVLVTMSEVSIVAQEDGSVAFFPGDIKVENAGTARVSIAHQELSISAFEDAGGMGYGIDADSLTITVASDEGTGETQSSFDGTFDVTALGGRFTRGLDALALELAMDRLAYDIAQKDPALSLDSKQVSDAADVALTGEITVPEGLDLMSLQDGPAVFAAMRNGLGLTAELTQGVSTGDLVDESPILPMSIAYTADPGTTSVTVNADTFSVSSSVEGMALTARPPMVAAPVNATADSFAMGLSMPVVTGDAPGEYGFDLTMGNLVFEDGLWDLLDPGAALERTPLDIALDLGGLAKVDLLDLAAASETGAQPTTTPELQSLDIRSLGVKAVGAALSGTGAFTFDNSMVAMGGPPLPIGTADLRLEGGNKVIDALIKLAVITEEDAMGARMMMAMFGQSAGDDVLTSKIEAREGGSIFVNGQQIQ